MPLLMHITDYVKIKRHNIIRDTGCERLKNFTLDQIDRSTIDSEISELKIMLDLLP